MHLTVETLLPGEGWNKDRADGNWMGGNVASVTERSFSPEGQKVLFDPAIMRLPVNPEVHAAPPEGLRNPFADTSIGAAIPLDVDKSGARYHVLSSLFDVVITCRLDDLKAVHDHDLHHP